MWMSKDQQMPITLAIDGRQMDLPVINVSGYEALNVPYSFTLDVLSTDPQLPLKELERQGAYLVLRADHGVHGRIMSVTRVYAGVRLSLYRICLGPALLDLQQQPQRRVFQGLNVPQIIVQLLDGQGIDKSTYFFEPLVGVYPPRDLCVQHDETDLHLLQRLCEEEGIHFRFEHQETGHLLIFADDPVCFSHRKFPVEFQLPALRSWHSPAIWYLAERWGLHAPVLSHRTRQKACEPNFMTPEPREQSSANHRYEASANSRIPTEQHAHERQISARALERHRCERRNVLGISAELPLLSGQIIQVQEHPEARFNDQWLVTEVIHAGKQPQALKGYPAEDVAAILDAIKSPPDRPFSPPRHCEIPTFDRGYRNSFRVLQWEMPFRAALTTSKPGVPDVQPATLSSGAVQTKEPTAHASLPFCFDQPFTLHGDTTQPRAPLCLPAAHIATLRTGAALVVGHFDDDPDRPLIYDVAEEQNLNSTPACVKLFIDSNGLPDTEPFHLEALQNFIVTALQPLALTLGDSRFELTDQCISLMGKVPRMLTRRRAPRPTKARAPGIQPFFETDLRLTDRPGLNATPLPNQLWYIVRMRKPGLQYLARLHPEDFLFEGKTDQQGYFGLCPQRLRELAAVYREAPDNLCLVHPGQCIPLQAWFEQHWPARLHQAFLHYR
jgi:type VI secretion system secreted protein VgrG